MLEVRNTFCEKMSAIFAIYYAFAFLFSEIVPNLSRVKQVFYGSFFCIQHEILCIYPCILLHLALHFAAFSPAFSSI